MSAYNKKRSSMTEEFPRRLGGGSYSAYAPLHNIWKGSLPGLEI